MKVDVFRPIAGTSVTGGAASAAAALPGAGSSVRLANADQLNPIYVQFGTSSGVTATTNSLLIQPGTVEVFQIDPAPAAATPGSAQGFTHFAYIAPSGSPVLNVWTGEGC